jgi:3-oxoacyl-[acyl-carrier protein] reductase
MLSQFKKSMLEGKTVLITGASRGIGKGIGIKFAEYGAYIGINYLENEEGASDTLQEVRKKGSNGILLKGDISRVEDIKRIVHRLVEKRKHIDILVNNAGIYVRNRFEKISLKEWEKTFSINVKGCYLLCKHVIPYMRANSKIIFISSQLAFKGSSHGADYAASKAALLGFMRSLALELASKKINVNAVAPGTIDTDIIKDYTPEERRKRIEEIPLKRLGTPEDVANVCLFLASPLSSYITGETINVNGGLYIH